MTYLPSELIKKKRNGFCHSESEIDFLIQAYTRNEIPDYQMSAWLMAVYFQGLSDEEILYLTKSMIHSGQVVNFKSIDTFRVDKHSTGGVGDKTSLILGPIVAAAGILVPMISGRGLGHTGGTLDKLESIPGFNTQLTLKQFVENVEKHHICFIGQTREICPADKKIYALRDVTSTVESIPLICASIMSKKLAEGINGLVLDVKVGSGAFMKDLSKAEELARQLMNIGTGYGKKVTAVLTNMNQPLGRFAGNALEVFECIEILKGNRSQNSLGVDLFQDTRELSLVLSAHMILLSGKYKNYEAAYQKATELLSSGKALKKFEELCELHSGNLNQFKILPPAYEIKSPSSGFFSFVNTEKVGVALIQLKAGRNQKEDILDLHSGIEFHFKTGDHVTEGDTLFTLYGSNKSLFPLAEKLLIECFKISLQRSSKEDLIYKVMLSS
ncbi:MAG: thymidine phosphorylase [Deltaproteobacteria bacterium]|nr:thymidine phosphorylase [Deltaproteobacteria bacterium]